MLADTTILQRSPLFDGMNTEAVETIRQALQPRRYPAGSLIFESGEMGEALYIVESGKVKIFRQSFGGKAKVLAYVHAGDVFGEMSLVEDRPRSATALAVAPTVVHALYRDLYLQLIRRFPRLAHNLARIIAARLREMNDEVVILSFEESKSRIAYALLKLQRHQHGQTTDRGWAIPVAHHEVANLAGTSRETATRVLHALRDMGAIETQNGEVIIRDALLLEEVLYGLR